MAQAGTRAAQPAGLGALGAGGLGKFAPDQHPRAADGQFAPKGSAALGAPGVGQGAAKQRLIASFRDHPANIAHEVKWRHHKRQRDADLASVEHKGTALLRDNPEEPAPAGHNAGPVLHGEGRPKFGEKRSLARSTSAWRTGSKIAGIPSGYTGSTEHELPVGSFEQHKVDWQVPKATTPAEHAALLKKLVATVQSRREHVVLQGHARGKIPAGTPSRAIHRAYNHAALLALHAYGVADYDFKMDPHLKNEMKPLEGFIRYARNHVKDRIFAEHKGGWKPYRTEFGKPFKDNRRDPRTGEVRLRVRANHELMKRALHALGPGFHAFRLPEGGQFSASHALGA